MYKTHKLRFPIIRKCWVDCLARLIIESSTFLCVEKAKVEGRDVSFFLCVNSMVERLRYNLYPKRKIYLHSFVEVQVLHTWVFHLHGEVWGKFTVMGEHILRLGYKLYPRPYVKVVLFVPQISDMYSSLKIGVQIVPQMEGVVYVTKMYNKGVW